MKSFKKFIEKKRDLKAYPQISQNKVLSKDNQGHVGTPGFGDNITSNSGGGRAS